MNDTGIDPTKVARTALQKIAGRSKGRDDRAGAGGMGGMGGMGM